MTTTDLRLGDYRDVLADARPDHVIFDPPYGDRTHVGHNAGVDHALGGHSGSTKFRSATTRRRKIGYASWTPADVDECMDFWHARCDGWICAMSCSDLFPAWRAAAERVGRVSFAPVACVIRGMSVRMGGDGPSSWMVYLNVSRPRGQQWAKWGSLVGAYVVGRGENSTKTVAGTRIGGKPILLMNAIVRDYSRPGDLICDPCAGYSTTAIAALANGRRFVGAEVDQDAFTISRQRLAEPTQGDLFG